MSLIIATRHALNHLRFDVEGKWNYGDALNLAYAIKAATQRAKADRVLADLRRVRTPEGLAARFLICDRLRRAMTAPGRVALVCADGLIDDDAEPAGTQAGAPGRAAGVQIARFNAEGPALQWLWAPYGTGPDEKIPRPAKAEG